MVYKEKLKGLAISQGFSLTAVHLEFDKRKGKETTFQNFSNRLRREDFKYSEIEIILDIIGHKITWEKK